MCIPPGFRIQLVEYVKELATEMYGLTTMDLRRLAFAVAEKTKLPLLNIFDQERGIAGKDRLAQCMKRHPTLSIRIPISTSLARANGFNREAVTGFFALLKTTLQSGNYNATRVWNCDETGFTTVTKPGKIVCTSGTRQVRKMSSG